MAKAKYGWVLVVKGIHKGKAYRLKGDPPPGTMVFDTQREAREYNKYGDGYIRDC